MRSFFVIVLLCGPSLANADPTPARDASAMHTDDCARARKQNKTCVIDMGKADDIMAERPSNDEIRIDVTRFAQLTSLVRVRRDFIVEILKTAEDL
ncbi:MAG: hypothetical protein JWO36_2417 [Myxococcales bacterium]|nr:hypothetical protein [Myxococcales bacterium]